MDKLKLWIKKSLTDGDFRISVHAASRSFERIVSEDDIRACGRTAKKIFYQSNRETWKVTGKDDDGLKLTVICAIREGLLVVTVF